MTSIWTEPKHLEKDRENHYYDKLSADRAASWFWKALKFKLLPWQDELVRQVFGWKKPDGTRKHRIVYVLIARKNGKTTFGAALVLFLLLADRELNGQVIGAADNRKQAALIFDIAAGMVRSNPKLKERVRIVDSTKTMYVEKTNSRYSAISADADSAQGLNASVVAFDELHTQGNRKLYDALRTCQLARKQPLMFMFTTAGDDERTIWGEVHRYALEVRDGRTRDSEFLPIIYALEPSEDWTNPDLWHKANPSIGTTFPASALAKEVEVARSVPSYQNTVLRYHFNIPTRTETGWMSMSVFDECNGIIVPSELKRRPCRAAIDLAQVMDVAALCLAFPPQGNETQVQLLMYYWVPESTVSRRASFERSRYQEWVEDGRITKTPGNAIDYAAIRRTITGRNPDGSKSPNSLMDLYDIEEVVFDPWGAFQFSQQLEYDGLNVRPMRQGFQTMNEPTKKVMEMFLQKKFNTGGDPVLRWMVGNAVSVSDPAGNIKIAKDKSADKVDGVTALIMATDGLMRRPDDGPMLSFIGG